MKLYTKAIKQLPGADLVCAVDLLCLGDLYQDRDGKPWRKVAVHHPLSRQALTMKGADLYLDAACTQPFLKDHSPVIKPDILILRTTAEQSGYILCQTSGIGAYYALLPGHQFKPEAFDPNIHEFLGYFQSVAVMVGEIYNLIEKSVQQRLAASANQLPHGEVTPQNVSLDPRAQIISKAELITKLQSIVSSMSAEQLVGLHNDFAEQGYLAMVGDQSGPITQVDFGFQAKAYAPIEYGGLEGQTLQYWQNKLSDIGISVYEAEDLPDVFGFTGAESDCFDWKYSEMEATIEAVAAYRSQFDEAVEADEAPAMNG